MATKNPIIVKFLNDPLVPIEEKKRAIATLKGGADQSLVASSITHEYGSKYSQMGVKDGPETSAADRGALEPVRGSRIGGFLKGAAKGLASTALNAGELGENLMKGAGRILTPKKYEEKLGFSKTKTGGEYLREKAGSAIIPKTGAEKAGFMTEQVAEFFIPQTAITKGAKLIQGGKAAAKLVKAAPKAAKALPYASRLGAEMAGAGAVGAVQEGNLKEGVKTAALTGGIGAVGKVVGKGAKKLSNYLYSSVIPSTITQRGKDFVKKLNIGEAVSKTGVSFSKKDLVSKIDGLRGGLSKSLDVAINRASAETGKTVSINAVVKDLKRQIIKDKNLVKQLGATPADMKKVVETIDDVVRDYRTLYKGKQLNIKDMQELKVALGVGLESQYTKAIGASVKAKPLTEMKLRSNVQKLIEKYVPDARSLNKELAPLIVAGKRLDSKGNYSGYLTDVLVGGMAAGSVGELINNPTQYLKNFLVAVVGKRALTSTAGKTISATTLKKIDKLTENPKFIQALRELIQEAVGDEE